MEIVSRESLGNSRILVESIGRHAYIYLLSDVHFDSKHCDRELLREHLQQAKDENALVFFNGDLLDVMGSFKDPRSTPQDIRPEYYKDGHYLDLVTQDCFNFLKPFAKNILGFGYGNHETNIMKRHDHDPLKSIQNRLNLVGGNVLLNGYKGFIFLRQRTDENGTGSRVTCIYHHHGYGGNAQRSKGILSADMDSQEVPFADIIVSGHNHQKYYVPMKSYSLGDNFNLSTHTQYHVRAGHYKDTTKKVFGWAVEKGFRPTCLGGWRVDIHLKGDSRKKIIKLSDLV